MRSGRDVSRFVCMSLYRVLNGQAVAYRQPAARPSLLGLDKLAAEKKAQAALNGGMEPPSKRFKGDDRDGQALAGGVFKGRSSVQAIKA